MQNSWDSFAESCSVHVRFLSSARITRRAPLLLAASIVYRSQIGRHSSGARDTGGSRTSRTLNFRPAGRGRFCNLPRPAPSAFSPSIPKHALHSAPAQGDAIGRSRVSLASRSAPSCINRGADVVDARNDQNPKKGKAGRLEERPAFLLSPPGCGVIEALGCVGRGLR